MLGQVSVSAPILTITAMQSSGNPVGRKSVNFHPSVWGDYFSHYTFDPVESDSCTQEVETMKEEVRKSLKAAKNEPLELIKLIDALQRLGVAYHFEREIEEALKQLHDIALSFIYNHDDLYATALFFRLLRQEGYNVSCDVFAKFKNDKGEFKSNIVSDVKGMLSLYEAAHLMFHGEDILEEALTFTTTNLTSIIKNNTSLSCSPLGRQVQYSLEQPLHRGMPRLEARHYISLYHDQEEKWSNFVRKLAVLDFNLVQSFHRKELSDLSKWWKELDLISKLPFARDRLVESYFWFLAAYFEPSYSLARVFNTKVIALIIVIDDIYDVYGTLEELQLFTDAIQRWDATTIDRLPEYLKIFYPALLDIYDEMEEKMIKESTSNYQVYYAKEKMKDLVRAYFVEAKWLNQGYAPKLEEYLENALESSAYYLIPTTSLVGMGEIISKEAFEWMKNVPKPAKSTALIARLMNDLASHKFEQERGHVASAVESYMEEYGVTEQEACHALKKIVEETWKEVNEQCFTRKDVALMPCLKLLMNLTRILYVVYKYGDTFSHSEIRMKERLALLLVEPVDPSPK